MGAGWSRNSGPYDKQALALNCASDVMIQVFGNRGRHTRCAVGAKALPRGAAVEIEALFEIRD
jgi:enamine deaminase RidA (YjgF/YER057c/UK114 family)